MPSATLLTEQDLVARGISVADQYRLRFENRLPTDFVDGVYRYPASAVTQLGAASSSAERKRSFDVDDEDESEQDPAEARAAFEAAVSKLTVRGVRRQRAILSVAYRQPQLHAAYLAAVNGRSLSPAKRFTPEQMQSLLGGWRAAVAAEVAAGAKGVSAISRAARKHPGLYQAVSGQPVG